MSFTPEQKCLLNSLDIYVVIQGDIAINDRAFLDYEQAREALFEAEVWRLHRHHLYQFQGTPAQRRD